MALFHIAKYVLLSLLGLSTNPDNNAPPITDLPAVCPTGEVYSACRGHCELTCDNKEEPLSCPTYTCVPACVCVEGLLRGPDGTCMPEEACTATITKVHSGKSNEIKCDKVICQRYCYGISGGVYKGECVDGVCECVYA
ncbi:hypothetical protein HNY73_013764 [Argiope bruennichi]|uniref:TIL domain-containing protein n=1 Tax=Argiope bruennichi TaxID=94029 RepID=A0A8T0EN67_ARGBR|nr:hypothetical protein HNY73_013764 [Argiope bruennichi]